MLRRDRVEDHVEAREVLRHRCGVARDDHLVRAEAQRVLGLPGRRREQRHVGAERAGDLQRHVPEAAEAPEVTEAPTAENETSEAATTAAE